ncbi:hypothetical protein L9F63_011727 [Diploptera punctata]|uniref:Uncharacterized protein n=1 Tax=Diploptera punctata TaxID=6984 RepID=A0AAD8EP63_DIPPU|nr:hypothetical protein L9F63_011727 [Diploptera punctata]
MVRATNPRHVIMLVVGLTALCVALPQTVMAIDLSRLYGHLNAKRNGESTLENQHLLHSTKNNKIYALCCIYIYYTDIHKNIIQNKNHFFLSCVCLFLCVHALFCIIILHLFFNCTFTYHLN